MPLSSIRQKTIFTGFDIRPNEKERILVAMELAYKGSPTARAMFEN
jgi:hypothetical protein